MTTIDYVLLIVSSGICGTTCGALLSGRYPRYTTALAVAGYAALAAMFIVVLKLPPKP